MSLPPLLLLHICAAIVGLLSGYLSIGLRKGSGLHRAAGSTFFASMLLMSGSAAVIAVFMSPNMLNMTVGLLTFYLVTTAWRAGRRRDGATGGFDAGALLFVSAVALAGLSFGVEAASSPKGVKDGMPAAIYFVFGTIALLCAISDTRLLVRGHLSGSRRIARHLWRMCLALLIATLSFYPGQAKLFPMWLRDTNLLFTPHVLLIGSMIFWKVRVSFSKAREKRSAVSAHEASPDSAEAVMI